MTIEKYMEERRRTSAVVGNSAKCGLACIDNLQFLHGAMGLGTESGEMLDIAKRAIFYGKPVDTVHVMEELGDQMWYIGEICDALGISLDEVMARNIAKLKKRYPEKFTEGHALNRDLDAERNALEKKS